MTSLVLSVFMLSMVVLSALMAFKNPLAFNSALDLGVNVAAISAALGIGVLLFLANPLRVSYMSDEAAARRYETVLNSRRLEIFNAISVHLIFTLSTVFFCFSFRWLSATYVVASVEPDLTLKAAAAAVAAILVFTLGLALKVPTIIVSFLKDA